MADSIFDFDPIAANNTSFAGTPYGPNQLYHNQIDNLFRAYAGALGGFVDDLGAVATPTGTATAIAVTLSQGFTGYGTAAGEIRHGTLIALKMPLAATAAATLAINAIAGTKKIRRQGDAAIEANDWLANGVYFFRYDTAYDTAAGAWVLLNAASSGVTFATNAQAVTGTSTVLSVNPAGLAFSIGGTASTATAAGTTTLTAASEPQQYFTGATTQTVVLPVTSTLNLGRKFRVVNKSTGVVTVQSSGANTVLTIPANGSALFECILTSGTTAASWASTPEGAGPHVILEDQQAQNTAGGTFTSGADRTRVLNTEVYDGYGLCSLSSNQFTLAAGTYSARWRAPAYKVDQHQSWLYNVTGTAVIARGSSELTNATDSSVSIPSVGGTVFTVAASQSLEIRHRCATTSATSGFGPAANFGGEVYTHVELTKLA